MVGPDPYGALFSCGLVRLLTATLTKIASLPWMFPVAEALLLPVADSVLVVVIFALLTNWYHDMKVELNVPVSVIVPPLPAGSVQMVNVVAGNETSPLMMSVMMTLLAGLPPLFPYAMV